MPQPLEIFSHNVYFVCLYHSVASKKQKKKSIHILQELYVNFIFVFCGDQLGQDENSRFMGNSLENQVITLVIHSSS